MPVNLMTTHIGLCEIEFYLPGVLSLKEKRGIIKSMLAKMRNTFNVSAAEVDYQDKWQSAKIAIVSVSNASSSTHKRLQSVIDWIEERYPDALITQQHIEMV